MDLINNLKPLMSIKPAAYGVGTTNGSSLDAANFREVALHFGLGTIDAGNTVAFKLQDSDDNATWADVVGAATPAYDSTSSDKDNFQLGSRLRYRRAAGSAKRYLRVVQTVTGAGSVRTYAQLTAGKASQAPV